ncbi:MAG: biotin/lipoyl-binding protein, partial [Anaerolineae bacterium]
MSVADRVSRLALYFLSFALFALVLAGCATEQADDEELLTASGFIEGQEVTVASQIQGLVTELLVARGDSVSAGDVVARLDDAALRSQRGEAQAALSTAQANLDRVLAGARAEAIAAAEAGMAEAEAARDGARQAVLNAREVISHPLSLDAQIDEARTQIDLAEQTVELHEAELEETRMKRNLFAEQGGDV